MKTNYLPSIINISLHPINSCVASKHALNTVEAKEKITNMKDKNSIEGDLGTLPAARDEGQLSVSTLGKASNRAIHEYPHAGKTNAYDLGGSPPPNPQTTEGNVLLQALEGANQALATRAAASNQEHLFMKVKGHVMHKARAHVKCAKAETLTWHGKPNKPAIEGNKSDRVFALAVCDDLLYTASNSNDIRAFQGPLFEELDCFGGGTEAVQSLMASEDFLFSSHQDNKIRVWKRPKDRVGSRCKHKLVAVLPKLKHCVQSMLSKRNYVQVRRHERKLWIEHADRISALALGGAGISRTSYTNGTGNGAQGRGAPSILYSASWDKTVKVWSLDNFKCMESFYAHQDAVNAMLVIEGGVLVTASADGTIKLWTKIGHHSRKKKHGLICTLEGHKAAVNALAISADSKVLYSGGADGTLVAWKKLFNMGKAQGPRSSTTKGGAALSGEVLKQITGKGTLGKQSSSTVSSCAVSRNVSDEVSVETSGSEEMIISRGNSLTSHGLSSLKKVIKYHNRFNAMSAGSVTFAMRKTLMGHTRSVLSVSTVADNVVCSSSADKTIRVWLRARVKRWEYACVAVLAGDGGPVKATAAVMGASTTAPQSTRSFSAASCMQLQAAQAEYLLAGRPAAGDPASHKPFAEEVDQQDVIVYSGGLDSKVWALQLPAR